MTTQTETPVTFQVETWQKPEEFARLVAECMEAYGKMWANGFSGRSGVKFDPDMQVTAVTIRDGIRRFVTARIGGKIVALQSWIVIDDVESRGRRVAHMTGIWKENKTVCDTTQFIRYGVHAMKAAGCQHVVASCLNEAVGLQQKMEAAGGQAVETIMRF